METTSGIKFSKFLFLSGPLIQIYSKKCHKTFIVKLALKMPFRFRFLKIFNVLMLMLSKHLIILTNSIQYLYCRRKNVVENRKHKKPCEAGH
jgi:hypothetical protein